MRTQRTVGVAGTDEKPLSKPAELGTDCLMLPPLTAGSNAASSAAGSAAADDSQQNYAGPPDKSIGIFGFQVGGSHGIDVPPESKPALKGDGHANLRL
jgi:hypothetical protein